MVILPIRRVDNFLSAAVARRLRIKSLGVEPHVFAASYCRHCKVPTDYIALYNDYFAEEYASNYGIERSRCFSVGSPRVVRRDDYDAEKERNQARTILGYGEQDVPLVLVAAQPLGRQHCLAVWRLIVRGTKLDKSPVRVLLKTHPEDGPSRVADYQAIINEESAADTCEIVSGDFDTLLKASDLVLVFFSVSALQAATLGKKVAVVNIPGTLYPLQYDKVLGIPLCQTVEEVSSIFENVEENSKTATGFDYPGYPIELGTKYFDRLASTMEDIFAKDDGAIRQMDQFFNDPFVVSLSRQYLLEE